MKYLWNYSETKNLSKEQKTWSFIWILSILSSITGLLVWLFLSRWVLGSLDWMICFTGYPVVVSWLAAVLYTCNHNFHDGGSSSHHQK